MTIKIILNPYANRWGANKQIKRIKTAFEQLNAPYELHLTEAKGHGIQLARQAAADERCTAIVAAGGDGTFNEVINGVLQHNPNASTLPLGILPIGTGNDFAAMVGLPKNIEQAAKVIAAGHTKQVDAAVVNGRYFHNVAAVAMEPAVSIEVDKISNLSGKLIYIIGLWRALKKLKAWNMRITIDGRVIDEPTVLLSICNTARIGGQFRMTPDAVPDDGLLDYVHVPDIPRRAVLKLLPRLLNGSHIGKPNVYHGRAAHIVIESKPGTALHADGEVLTESTEYITCDVLPGKLTLLAP